MTRSKASLGLCKERGCRKPWATKKWQLCAQHRKLSKQQLPVECTVEGCNNPVMRRGKCASHKYAEYLELQPETLERIHFGLAPWVVPSADGCWLYGKRSMLTKDGYGKFRPDGHWAYVHRWMYMDLVGPIPDGYQMHHECHVRNCVRPGHLTPVTPQEHSKLTKAHLEFQQMYPGVHILGPDRSHSDRERQFAVMFGLPADSVITDADLCLLQQGMTV